MEKIDSCNRRDKDSYGESIDDSPIVKAPTSIPVAGTRESAKLEERSVRRLSLMRNAQAYDCERLGYRFVKRCFDIVFSAAVIAVAFVPSLVLCAAIAIESPGCPLYRQKRVGRIGADGKPREFTMWKFRSMVKGADKMKDALLAENEVEGPMFKMKDDPRVTRIVLHPQALYRRVPAVPERAGGRHVGGGPAPAAAARGRAVRRVGHAAPGREAGPYRPLAGGRPFGRGFRRHGAAGPRLHRSQVGRDGPQDHLPDDCGRLHRKGGGVG